MNSLLSALIDCPNLSLKILDNNGQTIKTVNHEQLRQFVNNQDAPCYKDCGIYDCPKKPE
ncbi:MAG: hypothetical protein OQL06_10755 [Gammaproteobacteria bacterium]|nr:hypothetical protein [Gammaproteobacteria bacterium]